MARFRFALVLLNSSQPPKDPSKVPPKPRSMSELHGKNHGQIELAETAIKRCCKRVEVLEKKLVSKYVSLEDRAKLELELEDMRNTLETNKLDLQKFQKENSKSFAIAAIILFVSFLLYGFYLFVSE